MEHLILNGIPNFEMENFKVILKLTWNFPFNLWNFPHIKWSMKNLISLRNWSTLIVSFHKVEYENLILLFINTLVCLISVLGGISVLGEKLTKK